MMTINKVNPNFNFTKQEQRVFGDMVERDWKVFSSVDCKIPGCHGQVTSRIGWDTPFDDVHLCKKHIDDFLSYFNWYKNQLRKESGEYQDLFDELEDA
jgi:hypothetical protein